MQLPCFSSKCYTVLPRLSSLLASCCSWHTLASRKQSRVQACSYFMYNWNALTEWARSSLERTEQEFCQDLALTKPSLIFLLCLPAVCCPSNRYHSFCKYVQLNCCQRFSPASHSHNPSYTPMTSYRAAQIEQPGCFFSSLELSWNSNPHLLPSFQSFKYIFPNYIC